VRERVADGRDSGLSGLAVRISWQDGYAAFTVSATLFAAVREDIAKQEHHHRQLSFREELINLVQRAGIPFDERDLDGIEDLSELHDPRRNRAVMGDHRPPSIQQIPRSGTPFGVQRLVGGG